MDRELEPFERAWAVLSEDVLSGMSDWRMQHPRATLREIEVEWDGRLARLRARLLERVAQQSAAATWTRAQAAAPTCPACGTRLEPRGRRRAGGGQRAGRKCASSGSLASVRSAGRGFSPLDEELDLLPGTLTPRLQEQLAHLGTWMPFGPAAQMFARFTGVAVSPAMARRLTEVVGRAYIAVQAAEVERLCDELPPVPAGPEQALVSVDGAMVPLCGGEWAEVKTLVIGEVVPVGAAESPAPTAPQKSALASAPAPTTALSYCARLADVEQFNTAVVGELHRRGVETAGQVVAVSDGAEWMHGFLDLHCPQAVRILDFAHAAERVALSGQTVAPDDPGWLAPQLHRLKHDGPMPLLAELRQQVEQVATTQAQPPPEVGEALAYLNKRVAQLQYPAFQAARWPIGSGTVESGNQRVVESRLRGAGLRLRTA